MSYARYRAAATDVEALSGGTRMKWKLRQAQVELRASLPFLGDDIFVLIAAELEIPALGRLTCAAQRFWRESVPDPAHKAEDPGTPELWSVVEEGARRRLRAHTDMHVRGLDVTRETCGSWLRALREAQMLMAPLCFTAIAEPDDEPHNGHGMCWDGPVPRIDEGDLSGDGARSILVGRLGRSWWHISSAPLTSCARTGTIATREVVPLGGGYHDGYKSAVCGEHEMHSGRHYATFTLRSGFDNDYPPVWDNNFRRSNHACVGVVGPSFDPTVRTYPYGRAHMSPEGWLLHTATGELWNANRRCNWEGQPEREELKQGDVVVRLHLTSSPAPALITPCAVQGLLLDIGAGTLTVYVNGARMGDMVQPDMMVPPHPGHRVRTLEPPLRWAVDLEHASVEIGGPLPPPLEADSSGAEQPDSSDDDEASSGDEEDDESDEDSDEGAGESSDESAEESDDDQEEEQDSTRQA